MGLNSVALKDDVKFRYEAYTRSVLSKLNERNRTNFDFALGLNTNLNTCITLNGHCMNISIPKNAMELGLGSNCIEAIKIMIGHEMNHVAYAEMKLSLLETASMITVDKVAGNYKKIVLSACIETACDIKGVQLYRGEGYSLTDGICKEFYGLMTHNESEDEASIKEALKNGYLPATYRLKLMKAYKSFKGEDYEILDEIIRSLTYLYRRYMHVELPSEKYAGWIKEVVRVNNFSVRPNRK